MKKTGKIISVIFYSLLLLYAGLLAFPQVLFAHSLQHKSFIVYSHSSVPPEIYAVLDSAEKLLSDSEFFKANKLQQKVFLCHSFSEFAFFAPGSGSSFAVNYPFFNNVFFSEADAAKNRVVANRKENNSRKLSAVIAHETTHTLLTEEYGVKVLLIETWKEEGYCDYIARESSFGWQKGVFAFCTGNSENSDAFDYFKYRLKIDYLIDDEKLSFSEICRKKLPEEQLNEKLKQKYCR